MPHALPSVSSAAAHVELRNIKEALHQPEWVAAMDDELHALNRNGTWELVLPITAMNVVGSRWVFQVKHHADGSIECLKARLVKKGFTNVRDWISTLHIVRSSMQCRSE